MSLQKHNFYIVNKKAPLKNLAMALYGGENKGYYQSFIDINSTICPMHEVDIGQTLYLPSSNDGHESNADIIQTAIMSIDESYHYLSSEERQIKAFNHDRLALQLSSTYVGGLAAMISYRKNRLAEIVKKTNRNIYNAKSRLEAIAATHAGKLEYEQGSGSIIRLFLNRNRHFDTGLVQDLKLYLNANKLGHDAREGVFDPKLNRLNTPLNELQNYHLHLNRLAKAARLTGYAGIALAGADDASYIVSAYKKYGIRSQRFGQTASYRTGHFAGGVGGGAAGGYIAGEAIRQGLGRGTVKLTIGLLRRLMY